MVYPVPMEIDFTLMVSAARVDGWTRANGIGYNPSIDTATVPASCWGGTGLYPWMTALTSLEIVAPGSTQDINATGTGAWQVQVSGLDLLGNTITTTVNLNGATAVPLAIQFYRINSARVVTAGTGRKNTVNIIIRDAGAGTTRCVILAGKGVARQAAFTTPKGYTLLVTSLLLGVDSVAGATKRNASFETYFAPPAPAAAIYPLPIGNSDGSPYAHLLDPPIAIAQLTDFDLPVYNVTANATIVTAGWNGILKINSL